MAHHVLDFPTPYGGLLTSHGAQLLISTGRVTMVPSLRTYCEDCMKQRLKARGHACNRSSVRATCHCQCHYVVISLCLVVLESLNPPSKEVDIVLGMHSINTNILSKARSTLRTVKGPATTSVRLAYLEQRLTVLPRGSQGLRFHRCDSRKCKRVGRELPYSHPTGQEVTVGEYK